MFLLGRELFGWRVGLLAATLLAVSLWYVDISRFGLRTDSLPPFLVAALYLTWRTLRTGHLPAFMDDEHLFRRSLREIQLFSEQRPDAVLIPGHDMGAWRTLEPVYG